MDFYYLYSLSNLIKLGSSIVGIALFAHKSYKWAHEWKKSPIVQWGEQDFPLTNRADYYICLPSPTRVEHIRIKLDLHVGSADQWSLRIINMPTKLGAFYILPTENDKPVVLPIDRQDNDTTIIATCSLNPGVYRIIVESSTAHGQMLLPQCFKMTINAPSTRMSYRKNRHLAGLWKTIESKSSSL